MPTNISSIQEKIEIDDIRDGVIFLKDGGIRAVLMTSSVNFALKSVEEQDALIYHFREFLNSLDFPIQILIVSRKFNISGYLEILEQKQKEQENELMRIQASEYIDFIRGLTELANIVTESFYIVIPFAQVEAKQLTPLEKITIATGFKRSSTSDRKKTFEELKTQLWQRINYVLSGLEGFGLRATVLNNEELIELFYHLYNPEAKKGRL
ncbi:MAG: hypothetical protein COY11_02590 [Candidatus Portnoybacteria bacterium CG_4_10_14_0_2_um_filter_44_20]|uniref:TraC-like domain-containing protein n=3 Tax=Candidatus Portnoyibacteriota TaxID=1817913 RepID=A0A2H0KPT6_9BACT|nr:MAG: hypothetical protein COV85_03565 [Candidatus Portnoybacteria bacterium CG11_big_fil_rev_8_21_14_0_20_44_10]PIZ70465.1 MAG: hypothetical protein COY11_02590 [Candidatus Portnoybacteria bacterium CG_4_10_14_0_2_um_filter_44_20]PJA62766.1 MAG: hypothetical protein CO161_04715 [Candidatus Portnoybacteria bacterium CG_4_9_14_3_um_filter_44_9]